MWGSDPFASKVASKWQTIISRFRSDRRNYLIANWLSGMDSKDDRVTTMQELEEALRLSRRFKRRFVVSGYRLSRAAGRMFWLTRKRFSGS